MPTYLRFCLSSDFPVTKVTYISYPLITYTPRVLPIAYTTAVSLFIVAEADN